MPGPASSVEENLLHNILASRDRSLKPPVRQNFFARNLLLIMHDIDLSNFVGKNLTTSNLRKEDALLQHFTLNERDM